MEIILDDVSCYDDNYKLNKFTLTIEDNTITGVMGDESTLFLELLDCTIDYKSGSIYYQKERLSRHNISDIRKKVSLVKKIGQDQFFTTSIKDEMNFIIKYFKINRSNIEKKIVDALRIVGLKEEYLNKDINSLSLSEIKLLQIAIALLFNPDVILFDEPFINLDLKHKKSLIKLINLLKDRYNKTIVIASHDSNLLYTLTKNIIIFKDHNLLVDTKTDYLFKNIPFLQANNIEIPEIVLFTYKAINEKNIHLYYHKDVRDLMKDIYKNV